jgi:glycosyltransferase involved in cell wall biosynthesis
VHGAQASAEVFRDGWFYPGDEGVLEARGFMAILARLGDVLMLGGKKILVADIEASLEGFEGVKDHCVLALNLDNEDRLAVVVAHDGAVDQTALQAWIRARIPKEVFFTLVNMSSIPRNEMGEVARQALADKIIPLLKQNSGPQISVIFPVHNREEYLREAVDSVLAQTFTNFEFLIILDGSPPGVEAIISSYRDPRIRIIKLPHNFGVSAASNAGLRLARAPLIALMDSDDVAMPQRFARQYAYMQAHPEVTVCATNFIKQMEDGRKGLAKSPETDGVIKSRMLIVDSALHNPTTMFRTSFIRQHGLAYDASLPRDQDYRLFAEMMRHGATFYGLQEALLLYRRHANNVTNDKSRSDKEKTMVREIILPLFFPELTGMEYQILLKGMCEKGRMTSEEAQKFISTVEIAQKETRSFSGEDREELNNILKYYRQRILKLMGKV